MKNIFPIAAAGALLLIVWAFVTGRISLGFAQAAASTPTVTPLVQKEGPSSLGTTTPPVVHNPANLKATPYNPPKPTPKGGSSVKPVTVNPVVNTSNYSFTVRRPTAIQINS